MQSKLENTLYVMVCFEVIQLIHDMTN